MIEVNFHQGQSCSMFKRCFLIIAFTIGDEIQSEVGGFRKNTFVCQHKAEIASYPATTPAHVDELLVEAISTIIIIEWKVNIRIFSTIKFDTTIVSYE
ncbi:MAG: hypothetical protein ACTSXM_02980 [Promethearchaeota archaeon]